MDTSLYHAFYEIEDRHWWFAGRRKIVESLLERELGAPGPGNAARRILDVGCGTGGMLPLLSCFGRVTGIDSEPLALDYCRKRGFTDVHLQESFTAPHAFDVVTLFDVLEHVPDEAAFLNRLAGFLKPGGLLMVTVPAFQFLWSRHDELNHHQRRYTRKRLIEVLERAGFSVERSSYFNTLLFPAAAAVRLLSAGRAKGGSAGGGRATGGRTVGGLAAGHSADDDRTPEDRADGHRAAEDRGADDDHTPGSGANDGDTTEALRQLRIGGSNGALAAIFGSERHLLSRMNFPFGVSLYAIARVRGRSDQPH